MTLTNSQPHMEPVWVQNLKGFINGVFPADDTWKRIFVDQLDAAVRRIDELEQENTRLQTRSEYVLASERAMELASAHAIARHETGKRLKAEVKYEAEIGRLLRQVDDLRWALEPFAKFATKAERFVEGRALCGGDPKMPINDFKLGDFLRARDVMNDIAKRQSFPFAAHDDAVLTDNRPRYSTNRLRLELRHSRELALEEAAELHEREAAKYGGGKRWAKMIGWNQCMAEMIRALKGDRA